MPRHTPIQSSFNGGEFSPRMFGRTDLEKYRAAARRIENFLIIPQGGLIRRPGTRYVSDAALSAKKSRLVPFVFSDVQAYILEWSDFKLRIFLNEGQLLQQTLTGIDTVEDVSTSTDEITSVGHGYQFNDGPVQISTTGTLPGGLLAATDYYMRPAQPISFDASDVSTTLNSVNVFGHELVTDMGPYQIGTAGVGGVAGTIPTGLLYNTDYFIRVVDAANFELSLTVGGAAVTISGQGTNSHQLIPSEAYVRGKFRLAVSTGTAPLDITSAVAGGLHTITPTAPVAIELASPYNDLEVQDLAFAQSADVLYIAHKNHAPRTLSRFSLQSFQLSEFAYNDGPYFDENTTTTTLQPAALTGRNILLTSTPTAVFLGTDVGRVVRIFDDDGGVEDPAWGWGRIVAVNPNSFQDADVRKATMSVTNVSPTNSVTTAASHGMATGELVSVKGFAGGVPPTTPGLSEAVHYYVEAVGAAELAFFNTRAEALAGTPRIAFTVPHVVTMRVTSSVININAHGYTGGEGPVALSNEGGALPIGLAAFTSYYVGLVDANHITLSLSRGGDPVRIDDAETGGGVHTLQGDTAPAATCQIDIERDFKNTNAVTEWMLGAWAAQPEIGYPRAVTFHEQRLWWAGSVKEPQKVWSSRTAKFSDYAPTGTEGEDLGITTGFTSALYDDNAIIHEIGAAEVNVIQWMAAERTLVLGTSSASWSLTSGSLSGAMTPTDFQARRAGAHGAAAIVPVIVDDRVIYISDTQQRVFSLGYSFESDNYLAEDMTLLADHIGRGDLLSNAYAHEPYSTVWLAKGNGDAVALSIIRDQKIAGWTRHIVGGTQPEIESIAVIPSPVGDASSVGRANRNHDQVWLSVKRVVGGVVERWIEFMEDVFESDDILEDAFYVDGGSTYIGAATNTPGPFNHLKGETVDVLADGRQHLGLLVDATTGNVTLPDSATAAKVHAGYRMTSDFQSLRLPLDGPEGTAQANQGRIDHLVLRLDLSLGGKFGPAVDKLTDLGRRLIPYDTKMDELPALFSDDIEVDFDAGWETYGEIWVRQDEPLPFTLLAIMPRLQKSARGDRARG